LYEDIAVKRELFAQLGQLCRPGAVLATNTSTLDVDVMAVASGRAADVVGMHFFSPAHRMRLVEIVQGAHTAPDSVATALFVSKRLDKIGIVVGNGFGFVGNRMLYAYGREKEFLMLEGADPAQVDRALEAFGMAMGPNGVADLAGLDVGYAARRAWPERPRDARFYRVSDLLVESGRLGRKTRRGFYLYSDPSHRGTPDPEVAQLIQREAQRLGIAQRRIDAEEIVERCLTALINEGGRLLDQGVARSAADIDAIWCGGYGFPRYRGGPMFYAEQVGRERILRSVERFARQFGAEYWTAARWLRAPSDTATTEPTGTRAATRPAPQAPRAG
jgi:3-hydroxyacyl-CoA dehydrogenase